MGRKKLGRSKTFNARIEPHIHAAIIEQKPTANEWVNDAIKEKLTGDTIVLKGTMAEVSATIQKLKRRFGADTPISEVINKLKAGL